MEKCEKCGKPLEMYYNPWCPRCDKPQIRLVPTLNMIQCLEHLEAVWYGRSGIKQRVMDHFMDYYRNDTTFIMAFPMDEDREDMDPQIVKDLDLIKAVWQIEEDFIAMEVSW